MTPLTPPLCVRPPSRARAVLICGIRRDGSEPSSSAPAPAPAPAAPFAPATTPSWFWLDGGGDDDGNGTETDGAKNAGARGSFLCLRLFPLLLEDDFVLAIAGGAGNELAFFWNRAFDGGVVSSGVAGIGVGSTHSSSSKSPSPSVDADAVRAKLTA
jgi:hypothetical protein